MTLFSLPLVDLDLSRAGVGVLERDLEASRTLDDLDLTGDGDLDLDASRILTVFFRFDSGFSAD